MRSNFAQNLKLFRKNRGLSQTELAKQANLSLSQVSYLEREQVSPTGDAASKLAFALEIRVSALFEENALLRQLGEERYHMIMLLLDANDPAIARLLDTLRHNTVSDAP